jgi:peptidyl-prolyl cis-trans isomerase D
MRSLSQNWIGRSIMALVLGFIIFSFAIWGIGDRFYNFNAGELARVGTMRLSVDQYRYAYQNELQRLQQKERRAITNTEARQIGIDRQVFSQLLTDAILDQEASKLGLAISDDTIARSIADSPLFKGQNGQFDRSRFIMLLQNNGLSETTYVREERGQMLRQDVSDAITGGLAVPTALQSAIHRYQAEVRDVKFFVLPTTAAGPIPSPSDAQLQTFYDSHKAAFAAPEYRKLVILSLVPSALVKPDAVSDADVKKRYDEVKEAQFTVPEKRSVQQLVFATPQEAAAAKAKLDGGESFDKLVADEKRNPTDISLGTVTKGEIADPAVAQAAFALPAGATSAPVKGQFGTVLVHVTKILPMRQRPLIEVSAELKDEIAIIRANADARRLRDAIEDQRASGKPLSEIAASLGLKTRTIEAVDVEGRDKSRKPISDLPEAAKLLKAAFATDVGADTEMISTSGNGALWYEVAGIEPSHQLSLAEVRPQVARGWHDGEVAHRLANLAEKLVTKLNAGETIESVAAGQGKLELLEARDLPRDGGPGLPPETAAAFFDTRVGKGGTTSGPGADRTIFQIVAARVPPLDPKDQAFTKLIEQVKGGLTNDILAEYLSEAQKEVGVVINQRALQSALGDDSGS